MTPGSVPSHLARSPRWRPSLCAAVGACALGLLLACSEADARGDGAAAPAAGGDRDQVDRPLVDRPLAADRAALLDLAFRGVSAFPLDPHVKNRSRAQEAVVAACLELDQPARALRYLEDIANWRRGVALADVAAWCARNGLAARAPALLARAEQVAAEVARDPGEQAWRRDRIRAKVAVAHLLLGDEAAMAAAAEGVVAAEAVRLDAARARSLDPERLDAHLAAVDAILARADFEQVRGALGACAQLYDRFYADADRRAALRERVERGCDKLPVAVRLGFLMELAGFALSHDDRGEALALVEVAEGLADAGQWLPEEAVPMQARLAALRHRAGDRDGGRARVDAALALYQERRARIVDIYRAGALRPVAEALAAMGDRGGALEVYRRAAEEGVANPNSRPRAEDLSGTCCSMAVHDVAPDDALLARLTRVCDGLGDPW